MTTTTKKLNETHQAQDRLTRYLQVIMSEQCIPDHMRRGIIDYAVHHRDVGNFLTAIFENDFVTAVSVADNYNLRNIHGFMLVLSGIPSASWGSKEKVKAWLDYEEPTVTCSECEQVFFDDSAGLPWDCPNCHATNKPEVIVKCDKCEKAFAFGTVIVYAKPETCGLVSWACPNCGAGNYYEPAGAPQRDDPGPATKESS